MEQEGRQHRAPQVRGARCSSKLSQLQAERGFREDSRHKPKMLDFPARKKATAVGVSSTGRAQDVFPHGKSCKAKVCEDTTLQCKYFEVPLAEERGFPQHSLAKGQRWCFALH